MKKKQNPSKAREILWIAIGLMTLTAAIQKTIHEGFLESIMFWIFVIISAMMFLIRRNLRKKEEREL